MDDRRPATADGQPPRPRVVHHGVVLDDGHLVGVSISGHGVPLVLQHGVAMNRHTYVRLSSRLAALGFLVVSLDAAGHGETVRLPEPRTFAGMSELTLRTLDALGIRQAVFLGHSMGGRMTIELAAADPSRVLATILVDAAAGKPFDHKALRAYDAPYTIAWGLAAALCDAVLEQRALRGWAHLRYAQLVGHAVWRTVRRPAEPLWAVRAIAAASDSSAHLQTLANNGIPTFVAHARNDLIVPWESAVDMARLAEAVLYEVPSASHGWILADPDRGAAFVAQLLQDELADVFDRARRQPGATATPSRATWADTLIAPNAPIRHLLTGGAKQQDASRVTTASSNHDA